MKLTDSQREAITHRGTHLLLAASAGSGKTEVLARRVVDLIADPRQPCPVERLLVVTFTRAAAAELRTRIARMLRGAAAACHNPALRNHLRRQEVLCDAADICTFDAWCGRLVREHFAAAGMDPTFGVLSAEQAVLLRGDVRRRLFERVYRSGLPETAPAADRDRAVPDAGLAADVRAWLLRHRSPDERFLAEMVAQLNRLRDQLVNPENWLTAQAQRLAGDARSQRRAAQDLLAAALRGECEFQIQQLDALAAGGDELAVAFSTYRTALSDWCVRLESDDALEPVVAAIGAYKPDRPPRTATAAVAAAVEEVRTRWFERRLRKNWQAGRIGNILAEAPQAAALVQTLLRFEARYAAALADEKRRRNAYEFGDVQRRALDLLGAPASGQQRTPTALAADLREHYAHVLVDEFQDTSPVQVELLGLVTRAEPGAGNSFYVGDLKQSIYAFRQAEPRLFAALIDAAKGEPQRSRVRYLSDNFRSHKDLLSGLNRLFAALLSRDLGGADFSAEEYLAAGRSEAPNPAFDAGPRIAVQVLEEEPRRRPDEDEDGADTGDDIEIEKIEREAALAAVQIRGLLDGTPRIPEPQPDGRIALRPARPADIVILLRAAAVNAGRVATVLRDRGLACVTQGRESLLDELVVQDVRNVLALLANRRRELELAAYLRSPLVGLTSVELYAIRQRTPRGHFAACVEHYAWNGDDAELRKRVQAALARLDRWLQCSREEDLPALLRRLLRETDLLLGARGMPGGPQRVAQLRGLEGLAADFAATRPRGVAEFVEYLDALTTEQLGPAVATAAADDAVRILTIHAAKGLEFPIVFLLNAGAKFNQRSQGRALQADPELGIGLRFVDYTRRTETASATHFIARQFVQQRELSENLRLLYVAATRAREKLIIIGHTRTGHWDELRARFPDAADGENDAQTPVRQPPLMMRLTAASPIEWVMLGVAAASLHHGPAGAAPLVAIDVQPAARFAPRSEPDSAPAAAAPAHAWDAGDDAWLAQATLQVARTADRLAAPSSALPSVLSVSALKELRTRNADADGAALVHDFGPRLRDLQLAPAAAPCERPFDPVATGRACHRFLELADLAGLHSAQNVAAQLASLCADGRLTSAEAELVSIADIAWFAATPLGQALADHAQRVRRETPFVYALPVRGERLIIRGVIDCLLDLDDGIVILDYKTDRISGLAPLSERVARYAVQLGLYAAAAAAIFGRPVQRAALVFLHARHMADVPPHAPDVEALLAGLNPPAAD